MAKYLGGIAITNARWISTTAIEVTFTSTHTGYQHQLYYGRRKITETAKSTDRKFRVQVANGAWQNHLTVLAVNGVDVGGDFGSDLPPRPYNVAKLTVDASNFPADAKTIEIYKGAAAGGAVDTSAPWLVIPYDGARTYTIYTPPFPGSGTWNLEIVGRDNREAAGNKGTAETASVAVDAHPPDVASFSVNVSSGTGTITTTIPTD